MSDDMIDTIKTTLDNIRNIQNHKNSPGKFEGESLAANWYYNCYLNGGQTVFYVMPHEKMLFELNDDDNYVYVAESEQGFISLEFFKTESEADSYAEDQESDFDEDEYESEEE